MNRIRRRLQSRVRQSSYGSHVRSAIRAILEAKPAKPPKDTQGAQ